MRTLPNKGQDSANSLRANQAHLDFCNISADCNTLHSYESTGKIEEPDDVG